MFTEIKMKKEEKKKKKFTRLNSLEGAHGGLKGKLLEAFDVFFVMSI